MVDRHRRDLNRADVRVSRLERGDTKEQAAAFAYSSTAYPRLTASAAGESGPEPDQVRAIAFQVAEVVASDPHARNVNYNWIEPARTVRIQVDQDKARLLGLSSQTLAEAVNAAMSGITDTQMRSGIYLVDVLVRATRCGRPSRSLRPSPSHPRHGFRLCLVVQRSTP